MIAWWRRRGANPRTRPEHGCASSAALSLVGLCAVAALTLAYAGTKYRNEFPSDYSFLYGKDKPFRASLARTATNGAFDPRTMAGSGTCGSSGCHEQIYEEWKPSAHRYAAMDPVFLGSRM